MLQEKEKSTFLYFRLGNNSIIQSAAQVHQWALWKGEVWPVVFFWIETRKSLVCLEHFTVLHIKPNKAKYFRLRLTDEVSSERPKGDLRDLRLRLRLTWDWPETDLRLTWDWPETDLRLAWDWHKTDLGPETDLILTWDWPDWDWPGTDLGLTWDWPGTDLRLT